MIWPFRRQSPQRPVITGPVLGVLLSNALAGGKLPNCKQVITKRRAACPTREDVRRCADKARKPWQEDVWECEDQARALVHELQLLARSRGQTYAVGMLRASAPSEAPGDLHVFVVMILSEGVNLHAAAFDPTADDWEDTPDITGIDLILV
jgi:hypothetical protein